MTPAGQSPTIPGLQWHLAADRNQLAQEHDRAVAASAQLVTQLRTYTDLTMRDIATLLGLSVGRVAQITTPSP